MLLEIVRHLVGQPGETSVCGVGLDCVCVCAFACAYAAVFTLPLQ